MAGPVKLTPSLIQQAALMTSRGRTQRQIEERLGISQPSVNKALGIARDNGWFDDRPRVLLDESRIRELDVLINYEGLLRRLQQEQPRDARNLRIIRVFDVFKSPPSDRETYERYRRRFGELVAQYLVEDVFPHIASMGVSWGGMLLEIVNAIHLDSSRTAKLTNRVEFLPVCGDPPDAVELALRASSHLVASLDASINGGGKNPNNFSGVTAAISKSFDKAGEREILYRYFHDKPGYSRVFGTRGKGGKKAVPGLVDRVDAVLSSVGTSTIAEDPWIEGAAEAAGIHAATLAKNTAGNVGGLFLPRDGIKKDAAKMIDNVNHRWTGITLAQLLACSERSRDKHHGGTILVAFGDKVDVALACLRRGIAAEWIMDARLALGLAKALDFEFETSEPA